MDREIDENSLKIPGIRRTHSRSFDISPSYLKDKNIFSDVEFSILFDSGILEKNEKNEEKSLQNYFPSHPQLTPSTTTSSISSNNSDSITLSSDLVTSSLPSELDSNSTKSVNSQPEDTSSLTQNMIPLRRQRANSDVSSYKSSFPPLKYPRQFASNVVNFNSQTNAQNQNSSTPNPHTTSTSSSTSATSTSTSTSSNNIDESISHYHNRLWPGKAIRAFTRAITSCSFSFPYIKPFTPLLFPKNGGLIAPWEGQELPKINYFFTSPSSHSSTFFIHVVEETRSAINTNLVYDKKLSRYYKQFLQQEKEYEKEREKEKEKNNNGDIQTQLENFTKSSPSFDFFKQFPNHPSISSTSSNSKYDKFGWLSCEVIDIVSKSEPQPVPQVKKVKNNAVGGEVLRGSVWVVTLAVHHPNLFITNSTKPEVNFRQSEDPENLSNAILNPHEGSEQANQIPISGGDLMLLNSDSWSSNLLGIIQPWDPEYDSKLSGPKAKVLNITPNFKSKDIKFINLLVCVTNNSSPLNANHPLSWIKENLFPIGTNLSMVKLGNVMTYIRECQSLMSLRMAKPAIKEAIYLTIPQNQSGNINQSSNTKDSKELNNNSAAFQIPQDTTAFYIENAAKRERIYSLGDDGAVPPQLTEFVSKLKSETNLSSYKTQEVPLTDSQPENSPYSYINYGSNASPVPSSPSLLPSQRYSALPPNVPRALWNVLQKEFNDSQLDAIRMVCSCGEKNSLPSSSTSETNSPKSSAICLLQGPPGTGKTNTILGIISALLAGGLRAKIGKSRVIPGISFRSHHNEHSKQESNTQDNSESFYSDNESEPQQGRSRNNSISSVDGKNIIIPSSLTVPQTPSQTPGQTPGHSRSNSISLFSNSNLNVSENLRMPRRTDRPRILLCAPSNTAIDELVFRILTKGVYDDTGNVHPNDLVVVRINANTGVSNSPLNLPPNANIKVNLQDAINNMGKKRDDYLEALNLSEDDPFYRFIIEQVSLEKLVETRRNSKQTTNSSGTQSQMKYNDARNSILARADIICCTLSTASSPSLIELLYKNQNITIDAVIIDEAGQAVEPSALIPFKFNPQLTVLIGDHCQLTPTVFSYQCKEANYDQSLFTRLFKNNFIYTSNQPFTLNPIPYFPCTMLQYQYRMHPLISEFPISRYYENKLFNASCVSSELSHKTFFHSHYSKYFLPLLFYNVSFGTEKVNNEKNKMVLLNETGKKSGSNTLSSLYNVEEAKFVLFLYESLLFSYFEDDIYENDHEKYRKNYKVGIIAPYRSQRDLLVNLFQNRIPLLIEEVKKKYLKLYNKYIGEDIFVPNIDIEISTVDGFQGREKDIIIFTCVRANTQESTDPDSQGSMYSNSNIGFLKEWQRLNVALTRAKYGLWIVGNSETLRKNKEWSSLINHCESKQCLVSVSSDSISQYNYLYPDTNNTNPPPAASIPSTSTAST